MGVTNNNQPMRDTDIWMKGLKFCVEAEKEGEVNFMIGNDTYRLTYEFEFYQLRKNGGGYKSEFYTLGIQDKHEVADHLVEYVREA